MPEIIDITAIPKQAAPNTVMVVTVPSLFRPYERVTRTVEWDPGKRLIDYMMPELCEPGLDVVCGVNGGVVPATEWHVTCVNPGSCVVVGTALHGDDDDKTWIMALVYVVAIVTAAVYGAALAGVYNAAIGLGTMSVTTAQMIIMGAGSLLASAISSAMKPDTPKIGSDAFTESQVYSWGQMRQTELQGGVLPIIYGAHKVSGTVINKFIKLSEDNKEYLYMMLAVCGHEVDSITDIRINDQLTSYYESVSEYTRLGTLTDAVVDGFDEVVAQTNYTDRLVTDDPVIKTTDGTAVQKIELQVVCPYGLFVMGDTGSLEAASAVFTVEYKKVGAADYTYDNQYTITAASTQAVRKIVTLDNLDADQYMVRITRTDGEYTNSSEMNWAYLVAMREIVKYALVYPGVAKYAVCAMATDQLSGGEPALTCLVTRATVQVYNPDTSAWESKSADNPAWAAYDILANTTYGGAIPVTRIDYDAFAAWATYCDELVNGETRHTCNIVLDVQQTMWDALMAVCACGRAVPIRRGTTYSVIVDKAAETPVQLFSTGNIVKDSFKLSYLSMKDRANAIEITHMDAARDYTRQVVGVYSDEYNDSTEPDNKTSMRLFGVVNRNEVTREGVYRLNANRLLTRSISFQADIDAIAALVGDVIYFQHDVLETGAGVGGRVVSVNTGAKTVTIDRAVTLQPATTYGILRRTHAGSGGEDVVEELTVAAVGSPTTTATLTVTTTPTALVSGQRDVYAFGVVSSYKRMYRITRMARAGDLRKQITAWEYDEDIYTDDGIVYDDPPWDPKYQEAVSVWAREFLVYGPGGSYLSCVSVTWLPSRNASGYTWEVWLEDTTSGTAPVMVGTTGSLNFTIGSQYLVYGHSYTIYVSSLGQGPVTLTGNTTTITIQGVAAPPADVSGFQASWNGLIRSVVMAWSAVNDIDLSHYEIRYGGTGWADATYAMTVPGSEQQATFYWSAETNDTITFRIKAVDTFGEESENAASDDVTLDTAATDVPTPTGLALTTYSAIMPDGTEKVFIRATWNNNAEATDAFSHYELMITDQGTGYTYNVTTSQNEYTFEVKAGVVYRIWLRAWDKALNFSAWTAYAEITAATDSTAPATPTWPVSGYITAGFKCMGLNWNDNSEDDMSHYVVDRALNSGFTSGLKTFDHIDASFLADTELAVSTAYYYRVKAVDTSGNASGWSTTKNATTLQVGSADIAYDAVTANHIMVNDLEAINADLGDITAGTLSSDDWGASAGFFIDLDNEIVKFGGSSNPKLYWNGSSLQIRGEVIITGGTPTAGVAGLYLTASYFGYWSGSTWYAYIKSDGHFKFYRGAAAQIYSDSSGITVRGTLTCDDLIAGTITTTQMNTEAATARDIATVATWSSGGSGADQAITNLNADITAYAGNHVLITLYFSTGLSYFQNIYIKRGLTTIYTFNCGSEDSGSIVVADAPGAGAKAYAIHARDKGAGVQTLTNMVLLVVEFKV